MKNTISKKVKQVILVCFSVVFLTSCSGDFLDLKEEGNVDAKLNDNVSSRDFVFKNVLNLYAPYNRMYDRGYFFFIAASDDMVTGRPDNAQARKIKDFELSGDESYVRRGWGRRFEIIKSANSIIGNMHRFKDLKEEDKKMFLGEAYFSIGFAYFELAYHFANNVEGQGIPIITPEDTDQDKVRPRAKNIIKNFEYIEKSLLKAVDLLPYFKYKNRDRAHKTAALAYLAKTYLYWAQYDKSKYAKAVETADKVINSGKHSLLPNFRDVFTIKNNYSKEYIWSVPSLAKLDEGSILPGVMFENGGWGKYNGWGYFQPTRELYEAYAKGDKRREVTLLKEGDKFVYFGSDFTWTRTSKNHTGLMFGKYIEPFAKKENVSANGNHPCTDLNVPLMRYAEVLLIKAEALIADGKNGDVPLNKIRNRAGLPNISGATMDDLKRERRCELAGEFSNRHFDLVRWGDAQKTYSKPLHGMKLNTDDKVSDKYEVVWKARNFNPSIHNVWPIAPSVINKSQGVIKQNKGY